MALKPAAAHRKDVTSGLGPMQHRHFATVATIIKGLGTVLDERERVEVARQFAADLSRTNPKFDRSRFLRACNVEG